MNRRIARLTRFLAASGCLLLSIPGCEGLGSSCCDLFDRWPDAADQSSPADSGHVCHKCGKPIPGGENEGGAAAPTAAYYYNHPRFHPVPTQPVFTPRGDIMAAAPCNPGMVSPELDPPKPMLRPVPSTPGKNLEEIPAPLPALPRTEQSTSAPAQLATTLPENSSWLFPSSRQVVRLKDLDGESVSDSASELRTVR